MIYLDNAATTLHKPPEVAQALVQALNRAGNAARGVHEGALAAARAIYGARERLAQLFGCPRADHVAFTCNATEALNIAIAGAIALGGRVISTDLEHNSVLRPLYRLEAEGRAALDFVPADRMGRVDYSDFERMIRPDTRAIVCTHASNLTGNLLDTARIGAIARKHGLLFILDASQTAGEMPIDMETMAVDILCFTGHKGLMGPQGTGGLCVRPGFEIRPFKVGGTGVQSYSKTQPAQMPALLEAGTLNGHGIAGLDAALAYIETLGVSAIHEKTTALARRFYEGVRAVDGITVYGDMLAPSRAPIVTLNIGALDSGAVADELSQSYDIAVRAGAHCAPRMHQALGTVEQGAVRFSFSWFTREDEVDEAIRAVREIAR